MTPRTRTSNKDASYKVYYSKKVPQQVRFPHRRKTVRRPEAAEQDVAATRQMRFLPEKMRQERAQAGVELQERSAEAESAKNRPTAQDKEAMQSTPVCTKSGGKRKETGYHEALDSDGEPTRASSKRRRRTTTPKEEPSRTLRRQSTMTQLADGRRPLTGADEPDSKPMRRRSRVSWGGPGGTKTERDKKQRTLTQMVPGMGRLSKEELEELSDLDAYLEGDGTDGDAVSQSLVEQGLLESDVLSHMASSVQRVGGFTTQAQTEAERDSLSDVRQPQPSDIVQIKESTADDLDEEDYHPTQFIEGPTFRARQTPRRASARKASSIMTEPQTSSKSRFSLLSTPEKRRVIEIPSSQSPAESTLSTQLSPEKSRRSALRERTSNATVIAETPSKRRQVTFKEPTVRPEPPARLRKFESTIQDSEDEEESDLESNSAEQDFVDVEPQTVDGYTIGVGKRGVLERFDLACTEDVSDERKSSEEAEELIARQGPYQPSPELGESWAPVIYDDDGPESESYRSSRPDFETQTLRDTHSLKDSLPVLDQTNMISQLDLTTQATMPINDISSTPPAILPQTDEEVPSTPMIIRDDSSDDGDATPQPSPPHTVRYVVSKPPPTLVHQSTDLDGEPVQVPRSPSAERETQQSHSSKAEQQLQNEWLSYSQYVHPHAPNSSSMHAAVDAFSYDATPRPPKTGGLLSPVGIQHSQATTVDEVTPKKNRTQQLIGVITTPHRSSRSQPFISPEKPPSLFIPSSFPSPSRAAMEGWSSPVAARTQNVYGSSQVMGSLEDFSIPLPPPPIDDD